MNRQWRIGGVTVTRIVEIEATHYAGCTAGHIVQNSGKWIFRGAY